MKEAIRELGNLCKLAAELERKWDRAGGEYLGKRMEALQYSGIVEEYLQSVRCLEAALTRHLVAVAHEMAIAKADAIKTGRNEKDQPPLS